jgi:hypothetical protein
MRCALPWPPTPFNAGDVSGPESIDQVDEVVSYEPPLTFTAPIPKFESNARTGAAALVP